ncbi:MAG TPA: AMP nucleosidase, partial [Corynebacterium sp.]|nr:AMP nucleosidase [Corynebacterium sp.]
MHQVFDVDEAVDGLVEIYDHSTALARTVLDEGTYDDYRDVVYPKIIVDVKSWRPIDRNEPFGYVDEAGRYS